MKETITFYWNSFVNRINFYFAKKKADKMHKLTGKRYHVVPKSDHELMVVDNTWIDAYNRAAKKHGGKTININDLLKMSYYSTSVVGLTQR
jgi:hypothetical protein